MAGRTLIGRLILTLQDQISGKAKQTAASINDIAKSVDELNKRAGSATGKGWGAAFEKQIQRLKVSAGELEQLRRKWDQLQAGFSTNKIDSAMRRLQTAEWKTAAIGALTRLRVEMAETGTAAGRMSSRTVGALNQMSAKARATSAEFNKLKNAASVALIGGAGAYGGGFMLRGGFGASADRQREYFRQQMAGMSPEETALLRQKAFSLTSGGKYQSITPTQAMEMGRSARSMMGDMQRGAEVMEELTRGLVVLQSTKGRDAAAGDMNRLLRGIDNLGQNDLGGLGIKQTKDIVNGLIKAAQIEGQDFNPGDLFKFARRAKIAGPGLSTDFIFGTAPALMQDMTPEGFGTALSSAYQALVVGSNAVASRQNLANQKKLGIRNESGLVDPDLFASNPFQWVQKNLVPALEKSGINLKDNAQVSKAIADLSRNTLATGMLTRMVQQRDQIERLMGLYQKAMGTDAADQAQAKDPYIGLEAFMNSLRNLSAAVGETVMPVLIPALNSLSGGINSLAEAVRNAPEFAVQAAAIGAGVVAVLGSLKILSAGLRIAAGIGALGAGSGGAAGAAAGAGAGAATRTGLLSGLATRFPAGAALTAAVTAPAVLRDSAARGAEYRATVGSRGNLRAQRLISADEGLARAGYDPYAAENRIHAAQRSAVPNVDTSKIDQAAQKATQTGEKMKTDLSITAHPQVETGSLEGALALTNRLLGALRQVGSAADGAASRVHRLNDAYSDYGVTP